MTRGQLDKAVVELERSIKDTEKEVCAVPVACFLCFAFLGIDQALRMV